MSPATIGGSDHRNEVLLVGRLAAPSTNRILPSGDEISTWRLVVNRENRPTADGTANGTGVRRGRPGLDTLDCVAWRAGVRRVVSRLAVGDIVEVTGAVRRRFWRSGDGAVSRCEIEARRVRRLAAAGAGLTGAGGARLAGPGTVTPVPPRKWAPPPATARGRARGSPAPSPASE